MSEFISEYEELLIDGASIPDLLRSNSGNVGSIGELLQIAAYEIDKLRADLETLRLLSNIDTTKDGGWIDAAIELPPLLDGTDCSLNVWGWDGDTLRIVAFFNDASDCGWGNAYGDVWGDAEFDDDYAITHWQPILIPEPPVVGEI